MGDTRDDMNDRGRQQLNERGNAHGGRGRRAENNIADEQGDRAAVVREGTSSGAGARITPPRIDDMTHDQHARKGQAESPRELTLNQPEKKKHRGGRSGGR